MADMNTILDKDHEEILTLYQATIEDIERSKQWLWTVTYHTIIAQGGILAIHTSYNSGLIWTKWVFITLSLAIAAIGTFHIRLTRSSLVHFRARIDRCLERFGQPFQAVFGSRAEKREIPSLSIILGTTALIIILILFSRSTLL